MRARHAARWIVGVLAGGLALAGWASPASADTDPDAPPADPVSVQMLVDEFWTEFNNADFDGDGIADFADTDGDGVPNIPEGTPGDDDLRPGDGRFGQPVITALASELPALLSDDNDGSSLLFECSGMAWSYDSNGDPVDAAIGVGSQEGGGPSGLLVDVYPESDFGKRAFTRSNPFVVKDTVIYFGRMPTDGDGARDHDWTIKTAGISLDSGGDDNPDGNNRNAGEVSVSGDVPGGSFLIPSGIFPITGDLDSANGVRCGGDGWVKFETGNPVLSLGGLIAAVAGLGGIAGLLFNSRPAVTWKA